MPLSIYIHVPFCRSKCPYCAFYKEIGQIEDLTPFYLRDLDQLNLDKKRFEITTIYFGGGTPSLMPPIFFENIINEISRRFTITPNPEVTIEINPNTITTKDLLEFKTAGLTRPSFGVQSFDEDLLKFLGRCHTKKHALDLIETSRKNFKTFSCDFIYGLPKMTLKKWQTDLDLILKQNIPHLSLYSLSLESGTPFKQRFSENDLDNGEFYETTRDQCVSAGYDHYEISNFAKKKSDISKHNMAYWKGDSYMGLGPSAHGRIETENQNWIETVGPSNLNSSKKEGCEINTISNQTRAEEIVMMWLRTNLPLNESFLTEKTRLKFSDCLDLDSANPTWLIQNNGSIQTTTLGRQFLNTLLAKILKF
ncbi:MAG: radical SAM family heme chaperone HemW [Alphaproteobacteria bacterium]|nr:radical SAM family heme chaperone HemW [Alphaproteobacteria bacterium]MBN2779674.1 radical SAM family heme chaperone HemW [Alphaproteobacteria bacterium]